MCHFNLGLTTFQGQYFPFYFIDNETKSERVEFNFMAKGTELVMNIYLQV